MSQFTVYKEEPLDGRWAEEASNIFNIDWLLEITNGQEEYAQRRELTEKWLGMARILGLDEVKNRGKTVLDTEGERVLLRNLQHFVSVTPPDQRCPCLRGLVVESDSHYPGCEWAYAPWSEEAEEKMVQAKVASDERVMAEGAKRRKRVKDDANHIADIWRPKLVVYMSTSLLQDIEADVGRELDERMYNFTAPQLDVSNDKRYSFLK